MLDSVAFETLPASVPDHFVRFYDDDAFPIADVVEFLDSSLRSGGVAVAIARAERLAELRRHLSGFGSAHLERGWYPGELLLLDARQTLARFMVDGRPDAARFEASVGAVVREACRGGGTVVHAFGEMVGLLCEDGNHEAALALELLWNGLAERYRFKLLCAYGWGCFSSAEQAQVFKQVCCAHGKATARPMFVTDGETDDARAAEDSTQALLETQQKARALETEVHARQRAERTLRHREAELSDFVENAAEGMHKVGGDGLVLWANRAELKMLGYEWHEYVGRHIAEFHVDADVIGRILSRLLRGDTLCDEPARLRCKDGSIKHVLIQSNGHFEDGRLLYTRCFTRDAHQQHERELLLGQLADASRAKDEFLAMLGHELRNPLAPIVTALQLMRMRGHTGTEREQAVIGRQVEHLVRLVDDLLDVSRITRGKIELKKRRVELCEVLTKAIEMASPLLEQRNHALKVDMQDGIAWEGDPARLAQVVSNLLTNAARYTEPGGCVHLLVRRTGATEVAITVRDNGNGIAPDVLPHVFEMFFQGRQGLHRPEGGLGIGLALVKNLVEMHGGSVQALSEGKGRGSEFVVRLPVRADECAVLAGTPGANGSRGPSSPTTLRPRRVLVVDDNADAATMLAEYLAGQGHVVQVSHDPLAALALMSQGLPDVAILDIGLPVIDGHELAGRIRALPQGERCRLVALTGYGQDADKARSVVAGFEAHLVKPIDPAALMAFIEAEPPRGG